MSELNRFYIFDPNNTEKLDLFLEMMTEIRRRLKESPNTVISWHGIKFSLLESEK